MNGAMPVLDEEETVELVELRRLLVEVVELERRLALALAPALTELEDEEEIGATQVLFEGVDIQAPLTPELTTARVNGPPFM